MIFLIFYLGVNKRKRSRSSSSSSFSLSSSSSEDRKAKKEIEKQKKREEKRLAKIQKAKEAEDERKRKEEELLGPDPELYKGRTDIIAEKQALKTGALNEEKTKNTQVIILISFLLIKI